MKCYAMYPHQMLVYNCSESSFAGEKNTVQYCTKSHVSPHSFHFFAITRHHRALPSSHPPWYIQLASEQEGSQCTTAGSEGTNAEGQEHQRQIAPETMGKHMKKSDEQRSRPKTSFPLYWLGKEPDSLFMDCEK